MHAFNSHPMNINVIINFITFTKHPPLFMTFVSFVFCFIENNTSLKQHVFHDMYLLEL